MSFLHNIFGKGDKEGPNPKQIKKLQVTVDKISVLEETFKGFSDEQLKAKTKEFWRKLRASRHQAQPMMNLRRALHP